MKKIFFYLIFMILTTATLHATEITNPFYISPKGKITTETNFSYQKFHIHERNNNFNNYRRRSRLIKHAFSYGISSKVAILGSISNEWERKKFDNFGLTNKTDANIDWSVGALYSLYNKDNLDIQLRILYLQEQTHLFGGAYKAFSANAKIGYNLQYFLPYLGGEFELPIAQRKTSDNDLKYDVYFGLYKDFKKVLSLDTKLHYSYDKMYKSKKINSRTELSFLITSQVAIVGFFDYTFFDKRKNNTKADVHTIGGAFKIQF